MNFGELNIKTWFSDGMPSQPLFDEDLLEPAAGGGPTIVEADLASDGLAAIDWISGADKRSDLASAGIAEGLFVGVGFTQSVLGSSGVAEALFVGGTVYEGVLAATGIASGSFVGAVVQECADDTWTLALDLSTGELKFRKLLKLL